MKMPVRIAFAASMLLNGLLVWILIRQPAPKPEAAAASPLVTPLVLHEGPSHSASFDWKQIDSPDFVTYIANLRRIGCPEHAIRNLIEPELHQVVTTRPSQDGTHPDPAMTRRQVAELMQQLLTPSAPPLEPAVAETDAMTTAPSSSTLLNIPAAFYVGNAPDDPVITPAGISIIPSDATLTPETRQILSTMRQQFGQQVSLSAADPSSREYYQQWRKAQRLSDDTFAAMFGGDAFMRVQQQARLKEALAASQTASSGQK